MWPITLTCASVARAGEFFVTLERLPSSHALRKTALSVLHSRDMTIRISPNSEATRHNRLSTSPSSTTSTLPLIVLKIGSRTRQINPSPEERLLTMLSWHHSSSTNPNRRLTCYHAVPFRGLDVRPMVTAYRL